MHASFTAHIRSQLLEAGDSRSSIFLPEGKPGENELRLTRSRLDHDARVVAAWLQDRKATGQPVLLLYPLEGMAFVTAFVGCLYAGAVAVPAPLPGDARSLARVAGILADADIRLVLTADSLRDVLVAGLAQAGLGERVTVVATDTAGLADPDSWRMPELDLGTLAFLQYTSGSTSEPKGVMITQGNLLYNAEEIRLLSGSDSDTVGVSWLPQYHDMGLMGMWLQPLYQRVDCVYMSPLTFLKRPYRWLEAISHYRATATAAPDFAYGLCTRRVTDEQLAKLDLSSLQMLLNGAEPIRHRTLEEFTRRFAPAGLRPQALAPSYGLAEATLVVTGTLPGVEPVILDVDPAALERNEVRPVDDGGVRLVSSGRAIRLDVQVVDPDTHEVLPNHSVGEIWVRGGNVGLGYWNRPEATEESFRSYTSAGEGPYLRTGDLGFLSDGELFVTGRRKDLLIVNGRNLYPQDLEAVSRDLHPALAAGTGAAFSVEAGAREHLVLVQELKSAVLDGASLADLAMQLRIAVARAFDVPSPNVVLVERGELPRTTSGKVQRRLTRTLFLSESLKTLHEEEVDPAVRVLQGRRGGQTEATSVAATGSATAS